MVTFVDDESKFGFIHVPKTGGMTVTRYFFESNHDPKILDHSPSNAKFGIHSGAGDVKKALGSAYSSYFTFAWYRNTYDWLYSLYRYIDRSKHHPKYPEVHGKGFEHYVFNVAPGFLRPQRPMVAPEGKNIVTRLEDYANFNSTFPEILEQLGFGAAEFRSYNVSKRKSSYKEAYSEKMVRRVSELYEDDISFFGFRF